MAITGITIYRRTRAFLTRSVFAWSIRTFRLIGTLRSFWTFRAFRSIRAFRLIWTFRSFWALRTFRTLRSFWAFRTRSRWCRCRWSYCRGWCRCWGCLLCGWGCRYYCGWGCWLRWFLLAAIPPAIGIRPTNCFFLGSSVIIIAIRTDYYGLIR